MRELESNLDSDEITLFLPLAYHHNGDIVSLEGGINLYILQLIYHSLIDIGQNWVNMHEAFSGVVVAPELHQSVRLSLVCVSYGDDL